MRAVAGDGLRCVPGDRDACGDGGPALRARLTYPKVSATKWSQIDLKSPSRSRMVFEVSKCPLNMQPLEVLDGPKIHKLI